MKIIDENIIQVLKNTNNYPKEITQLKNNCVYIKDITVKNLVELIRNKQPISILGSTLALTQFITIMNICKYEGVNEVIINNKYCGTIPNIFLGNLKGSYCFSNSNDVMNIRQPYYKISFLQLSTKDNVLHSEYYTPSSWINEY